MRVSDTAALIVVDVQNDFCTGSLAVPGGEEIVPLINAIMPKFKTIVATQDWHPLGHVSFASSHQGTKPFTDTIVVGRGTQRLWPDHCVQGSLGAAFHPDLETPRFTAIVRKGMDPVIDSYSGFQENDHQSKTGLAGLLKGRGVKEVYVCGLALDFCVLATALDAVMEGFATHLVIDCCRAVDVPAGAGEQAVRRMEDTGVKSLRSADLTDAGFR